MLLSVMLLSKGVPAREKEWSKKNKGLRTQSSVHPSSHEAPSWFSGFRWEGARWPENTENQDRSG